MAAMLITFMGSPQREWITNLAAGTIFRSGEVPGRSRAAVRTFLSRAAADDTDQALCARIGRDLYWRPTHDPETGRPQAVPPQDALRKVLGPGFGPAGHTAGVAAKWLTHSNEPHVQIAAVGNPPAVRPMPRYVIRRRSNTLRKNLNPTEVAYPEAVRFFDECAEVRWDEALRITAANAEHRDKVRPAALREAAGGERLKNVALLRTRIGELCDVIEGTAVPPARDAQPEDWPGRPAVLDAAHLPQLMSTSQPGRGQSVPISQFVNDWAYWADNREAMCVREPSGPNRLHLVWVAATVHALCDRDGVPVPAWVWKHRWHEDVLIYGFRPVKDRDRTEAVPACSYHRVWFNPSHIINYRVHGFWTPPAL